MEYTATSKDRIRGIHGDLQSVLYLAAHLCLCDFQVSEGLRTPERQAELFAAGKSKTLNSRHLTGHAVDVFPLVDGRAVWDNDALWQEIARAMKAAADELEVKIEWGGDWQGAWDKPHFQLPWASYPA